MLSMVWMVLIKPRITRLTWFYRPEYAAYGWIVPDQEPARLPTIQGSSDSDADNRIIRCHENAGRAAGATGWLVKPFDPQKLVEVVER